MKNLFLSLSLSLGYVIRLVPYCDSQKITGAPLAQFINTNVNKIHNSVEGNFAFTTNLQNCLPATKPIISPVFIKPKNFQVFGSLKTPLNKTPLNKTPQNKTQLNKTQLNKTPQNKTLLNKTPQNKTLLNKTPQNKTQLDKTPLNKTPPNVVYTRSLWYQNLNPPLVKGTYKALTPKIMPQQHVKKPVTKKFKDKNKTSQILKKRSQPKTQNIVKNAQINNPILNSIPQTTAKILPVPILIPTSIFRQNNYVPVNNNQKRNVVFKNYPSKVPLNNVLKPVTNITTVKKKAALSTKKDSIPTVMPVTISKYIPQTNYTAKKEMPFAETKIFQPIIPIQLPETIYIPIPETKTIDVQQKPNFVQILPLDLTKPTTKEKPQTFQQIINLIQPPLVKQDQVYASSITESDQLSDCELQNYRQDSSITNESNNCNIQNKKLERPLQSEHKENIPQTTITTTIIYQNPIKPQDDLKNSQYKDSTFIPLRNICNMNIDPLPNECNTYKIHSLIIDSDKINLPANVIDNILKNNGIRENDLVEKGNNVSLKDLQKVNNLINNLFNQLNNSKGEKIYCSKSHELQDYKCTTSKCESNECDESINMPDTQYKKGRFNLFNINLPVISDEDSYIKSTITIETTKKSTKDINKESNNIKETLEPQYKKPKYPPYIDFIVPEESSDRYNEHDVIRKAISNEEDQSNENYNFNENRKDFSPLEMISNDSLYPELSQYTNIIKISDFLKGKYSDSCSDLFKNKIDNISQGDLSQCSILSPTDFNSGDSVVYLSELI